MTAEKPNPVWVFPRIGRWITPGLLSVGLWALAGSAMAQPLEPGIQSADGRHFLLDKGVVRVLAKDFREESEAPNSEEVNALFQGKEGWGGSFLAMTGKGLARVSTATPQLEFETMVAGEAVKVEPWGQNFLAYLEKGAELVILTPDQRVALPLNGGALESIETIDPSLALVRTDKSLATLTSPTSAAQPTLDELDLPFPLAEARTSAGGGRAAVWSPKSLSALLIGSGPAALAQLPEKPVHGLRVLQDGTLVSGGERLLSVIPVSGAPRQYPRPAIISEALFADWTMSLAGGNLQLFIDDKGRTRALHFRGGGAIPSDLLPVGKIRTVILPEPGKAGQALLFQETTQDEPKFDEAGRPVLDLEKDKQATLTVNGHRVYALEDSGRWVQVADEPRAALVGPIQRVGDRVIYATQTEPLHLLDQALELDNRYPYPAVILHGRSQIKPREEWLFQKPRGQTPSKGRVPDDVWPLLKDGAGPLLITSEGGSLLAIDPSTGQLKWSSPELPMDDSSPLMLNWSDGFGLVAAKSTGRALLLLDAETGAWTSTVTLNEFFFREKWRHLLGVLIVCAALAYYIYAAGKRTLYIRKIAGLQALDEAVGRATEMGKPVLYVVGLADVDDIQTMASLSILSHVARKTAEYDTPIITTTARAVAFSAAQEIVRDAFSVAGRPDAFSVESVRYISDDQFGYTAGVDGIMVREKPAANFYIGNFYAESLILAETGHATGSIQIAGTAQPSQVPFFVAACDYTLIGEELFAASAYLSRDPLQVGSLRGQDVGKAIVMVLLVVCSLLVSFGIDWAYLSDWTGVSLP